MTKYETFLCLTSRRDAGAQRFYKENVAAQHFYQNFFHDQTVQPWQEAALMGRRLRPTLGFTLVELLVAMSIFASVATLAFGTFRFVMRERENLARTAAAEKTAGACLERMARDLSSLYVSQPPVFIPPEGDDPPPEFRMAGDASDQGGQSFGRLAFASLAHVGLEGPFRKGIAQISYYSQDVGDGDYIIRRSDRLYPYPMAEGAARDPVLCENVKSLAFYFYDSRGEVSTGWDSASEETGYASPVAVRIALEVENDGQGRILETTVVLPVHREPRN